MKLNRYIKESNTSVLDKYDDFIDSVRAQCKPWLKAISSCKIKHCIRGYNPKDVIEKRTPRKDRKPRDTPKDIQASLDDEFSKKFGWKVRSEGLFTWGGRITGGYGTAAGIVFPTGNFDFVWSKKVYDLFMYYDKSYKPSGMKDSEEEIEYRKEWVKRTIDTYTNKNLCEALSSTSEIVIKCNSYWIIRKNFLHNMYDPPGDLLEREKFSKFIEDVLIRGNV